MMRMETSASCSWLCSWSTMVSNVARCSSTPAASSSAAAARLFVGKVVRIAESIGEDRRIALGCERDGEIIIDQRIEFVLNGARDVLVRQVILQRHGAARGRRSCRRGGGGGRRGAEDALGGHAAGRVGEQVAVQLGAVVVVEVVADLQRVRVDNGAQPFKVHGKGVAVLLTVGGEVDGGVLRGIRGVDKRRCEGQRVDERVALAGCDAGEFLKAEFIDKARRDAGSAMHSSTLA